MNTQTHVDQIFEEYTASTPARITLKTPNRKEVKFEYQTKAGPGGYHQRFNGLFVAHTEIAYCLTTIAHIHYANDPTHLTGYFEMEMTFGSGEEERTERISNLTLNQVCEIIDKDDSDFCFELFTNRSIYNKYYWPA